MCFFLFLFFVVLFLFFGIFAFYKYICLSLFVSLCFSSFVFCERVCTYTRHYTTPRLHYTALHYTTLHNTTLHNTTLHYTALHHTTPHHTTPHHTHNTTQHNTTQKHTHTTTQTDIHTDIQTYIHACTLRFPQFSPLFPFFPFFFSFCFSFFPLLLSQTWFFCNSAVKITLGAMFTFLQVDFASNVDLASRTESTNKLLGKVPIFLLRAAQRLEVRRDCARVSCSLSLAPPRGRADPGRLQEGVLTGRLQEGVQPRFRTRVCSHELVTAVLHMDTDLLLSARSSARSEPAVIVSDFVHMRRRTGTYPGADRSDVVSALHDL